MVHVAVAHDVAHAAARLERRSGRRRGDGPDVRLRPSADSDDRNLVGRSRASDAGGRTTAPRRSDGFTVERSGFGGPRATWAFTARGRDPQVQRLPLEVPAAGH